jgi:hypothetical protein
MEDHTAIRLSAHDKLHAYRATRLIPSSRL